MGSRGDDVICVACTAGRFSRLVQDEMGDTADCRRAAAAGGVENVAGGWSGWSCLRTKKREVTHEHLMSLFHRGQLYKEAIFRSTLQGRRGHGDGEREWFRLKVRCFDQTVQSSKNQEPSRVKVLRAQTLAMPGQNPGQNPPEEGPMMIIIGHLVLGPCVRAFSGESFLLSCGIPQRHPHSSRLGGES